MFSLNCLFSQLKSDQDGIEIGKAKCLSSRPKKLKSDQDGIEILSPHHLRLPLRLLKSDQDGIEIIEMAKCMEEKKVKIRPRWD